MRIRGTKPEFWKSRRISSVSTELAFDGQFPSGRHPYVGLPKSGANFEFVYLLLSSIGSPIYVGRSWRPADRFTKHRRKDWWQGVEHLTLIRVYGASRLDATVQTAFVERVLIEELAPSGNLTVGQRRWATYGSY